MPDAFEVGDLGYVVRRPEGDAIQAAIDVACGGGDPAKVARRATGPVILPPGTYKLTRPLRVASVSFLEFRGAGRTTKLYPVGEMDSVLDLNGVAFSTFGDFLIEGDDTESVGDVIRYYWDPATAGRSSCGNVFRSITVFTVRCKAGFRIGLPASTAQTDTTSYENITLAGGWTPGEAEWWQAGFVVGTGAHGNNILHSFWRPGVTGWANGFRLDASSMTVLGMSLGGNDVDFNCNALGYVNITGGRCEESRRLLTNGGGPTEASANVTLSDVQWATTKCDPDGGMVWWSGVNGNLSIRNLYVSTFAPNARIIANPWMGMTITLDGVQCANTLDGFLSGITPKVDASVRGFTSNKPDGSGWAGQSHGIVATGPPTPNRGPLVFPGLGSLEAAPDARLVWTPTGKKPIILADPAPGPTVVVFPGIGQIEAAPDGRLVWISEKTKRPVVIARP